MSALLTPMRWPAEWKDPALIDLLRGSPVDALVTDNADIVRAASQASLPAMAAPPADVNLVTGAWAGLRRGRVRGQADSGPTGTPWVDSNGWRVRLERALRPGAPVWIEAEPPKEGARPQSYPLAIADAAVHGGRWLITLASELASGIATRRPESLDTWQRMKSVAQFFAAHADWDAFEPVAVIGVVSEFSGAGAFLSREVLNLTARLQQPYRILPASKLTATSLGGLRAVIFPGPAPPSPAIRKLLQGFAENGGVLIASPKWGASGDTGEHPRYSIGTPGKGRIAVAKADLTDPYLIASDAQILVSHRADLVRFWNAAAMGSFYTRGKAGAMVHLVNYATEPGRFPISVWVAGAFRSARLWTIDDKLPKPLEVTPARGGVELHLPPVPLYAAIELQ